MTTTTKPRTIATYVTENWQYFGRTWRTIAPAIKHYQKNPDELKNEQVGLNSFKAKETTQERDASTLRIESTPNPNRFYGELMTRIRQLHDLGYDAEAIQKQIGAVPELSDIPGDLLSVNSIMAIVGTGKPIWRSLKASTKEMKK